MTCCKDLCSITESADFLLSYCQLSQPSDPFRWMRVICACKHAHNDNARWSANRFNVYHKGFRWNLVKKQRTGQISMMVFNEKGDVEVEGAEGEGEKSCSNNCLA